MLHYWVSVSCSEAIPHLGHFGERASRGNPWKHPVCLARHTPVSDPSVPTLVLQPRKKLLCVDQGIDRFMEEQDVNVVGA